MNISTDLYHWFRIDRCFIAVLWFNMTVIGHMGFRIGCRQDVLLWRDRDLNTNRMMTSSNGNIFRVTGPLCGEFTGHRWILCTKASDAELWCFFLTAPWINGWVKNGEAGDLRGHRTHYDVIVMDWDILIKLKLILDISSLWWARIQSTRLKYVTLWSVSAWSVTWKSRLIDCLDYHYQTRGMNYSSLGQIDLSGTYLTHCLLMDVLFCA